MHGEVGDFNANSQVEKIWNLPGRECRNGGQRGCRLHMHQSIMHMGVGKHVININEMHD